MVLIMISEIYNIQPHNALLMSPTHKILVIFLLFLVSIKKYFRVNIKYLLERSLKVYGGKNRKNHA